MAELTTLESKIGEVVGLAMAAQQATDKVAGMCEDGQLKQRLQQMHDEAAETEQRGTELAGTFDGKKTAILEKANETKSEVVDMMNTYLGGESDPLDGFEFLTMAEAGEVGHWKVVEALNKTAQNDELQQLIDWVTPIQQRHFESVLDGSVQLSAEEDPNAPA